MSSTQSDALDRWLADLTGGETSMRRLRRRLTAEGTLGAEPCPTCEHPATDDLAHTGHRVPDPAG
ncbi:hypothetical protein [Modestobacter marinus]|nr:hypothetical protein [Modestobacter marinus]NIH68213.1 hypothetical protein [Modestobacter marinus]